MDIAEAEKYFNEGIAELERGAYGSAIAKFTEVIKIDQKNAVAYYYRGVAKVGLKQYHEAIADFDEALEINPEFIDAYSNRYYAKKELGRDDVKVDCDGVDRIAKEWVRENKKKVINSFCVGIEPNESQFAIFMCGSPGAGKTKEAQEQKESYKKKKTPCVHIEQDAIKGMIPGYTGTNAELFQRAATKGLVYVLDHCCNKRLSFISDSTFSEYEGAKSNIKKAIKKGRIKIVYIYQEPLKAWESVKEREEDEGRNVPVDSFINSYFGAFDTLKKIKDEYGSKVSLRVVNRHTGKVYIDVDRVDSCVKLSYSNSTDLKNAIEEWEKAKK